MTVLKAALNLAYQSGEISSDGAWRRLKPFPKVDVPKMRYLFDDECRRLMAACAPDSASISRLLDLNLATPWHRV